MTLELLKVVYVLVVLIMYNFMNHYLFQLQMDGCDDCTGRIQRPVKLHSRINMGHHLRFSRKMPSNPVLGGAHHVWILTPKSEFDAGPGPSITM